MLQRQTLPRNFLHFSVIGSKEKPSRYNLYENQMDI